MRPQRDILVLTKAKGDQEQIEQELDMLNNLLYQVESLHQFCIANEVADLNRYRIYTEAPQIQRYVQQRRLKPFVFFCNKN